MPAWPLPCAHLGSVQLEGSPRLSPDLSFEAVEDGGGVPCALPVIANWKIHLPKDLYQLHLSVSISYA